MKNLQSLQKAINDPSVKAVSFDVFDTLLVRPLWIPSDLFLFLDMEAGQITGSPDVVSFSACRREAEKTARRKACAAGREDITFDEIYREISDSGLFSGELTARLKAKELELEMRFCQPRSSGKALLETALNSGKTVAVISDMYLSPAFISGLLEKCGIPVPQKIYVSGQEGLTKRSGSLYRHVLRDLGIRKQELLHIGDNPKSDAAVPRKLGIRAHCLPRTVRQLSGGHDPFKGKAYRHAFQQICSPLGNIHAINTLGIRCMLAVAANILYDDPFRRTDGVYADDPELFGTLALGMYCMAHVLWLCREAEDAACERILFFARDSDLIRRGTDLLLRHTRQKITTHYVRISRKVTLPLLLTEDKLLYTAAFRHNFSYYSPASIWKAMSPVLKSSCESPEREMASLWNQTFRSEEDLLLYLKKLRQDYLDEEKAEAFHEGFHRYFSPFMSENVMTFDTGYHLRVEILLKHFFPNTKITACCTHVSGDLARERSVQNDIRLRCLYQTRPIVSGSPRELIQSEQGPRCVGYTREGRPVLEENSFRQPVLDQIHQAALTYMETFISIFGADALRLPLNDQDACLPMEAFLHSPTHSERKWLCRLEADLPVEDQVIRRDWRDIWRQGQLSYRMTKHHTGPAGRYIFPAVMLSLTNRPYLRHLIRTHIPTGKQEV